MSLFAKGTHLSLYLDESSIIHAVVGKTECNSGTYSLPFHRWSKVAVQWITRGRGNDAVTEGSILDEFVNPTATPVGQDTSLVDTGEGRFQVAVRTTSLPNGSFHYEYVVMNFDFDRRFMAYFEVELLSRQRGTYDHEHENRKQNPGHLPISSPGS